LVKQKSSSPELNHINSGNISKSFSSFMNISLIHNNSNPIKLAQLLSHSSKGVNELN